MNPYADELLRALKTMDDRGKSFMVWLKDSDNFGRHEQLKESMEEWMFINGKVAKLVPKFWAEQEKMMGEAPINMDDLSEVMM